ncbi:CpaF family protein [bacterium]|nr:CpaF family protein [bacterium]
MPKPPLDVIRETAAALGISATEAEILDDLKLLVHQRLLTETDFRLLQTMGQEDLVEQIRFLTQLVGEERNLSLSARAKEQVQAEVLNEVMGYGPIQTLLDDPSISEVMINGPESIYVERSGKLHRVGKRFVDDAHVMRIIEKIIAPLGRRLDESMPMVDARLPDGSRVNAIIPPISINGPCVTIRKFSVEPLKPRDLVNFGTMSESMARFLEACVTARLNIMVSGGTGSGKTTTLNVLSGFIPHDERIVTIEDAAELRLQQEHVITLESRPPNLEGKGEITIRHLVRNALRMRPERIVVGECRGAEALDMLQAMNTGHDGSLSTVHSNSPRDTLSRLETMVLMAGMALPTHAIREQVSSALDLIVHQERLRDGSRRVTHVTEVQRMEMEEIVLQDIFVFKRHGFDKEGRIIGEHTPRGIRPLFMEKLEAEGLQLGAEIFEPNR